jgi:hypothetical protein
MHILTNYIDTKAKCRHQNKNGPLKGLCGRCSSIDWSYSQSCWYFRPSFVNCCPSNLARTRQEEKREYTHFLRESKYEVSGAISR